ncbi:hypothetical protein ACTQ5K_05165 [Niallia sp. Sow4_A1]|uniref:Uncharacterized protein n=1 Tax=Niallia hominis TaxID=3133173 RepID=A0ABV1EX41_9BACI|nr:MULTISPECIES: hypothetical protein [Bacillaceae]MCF2646829.1 hypothetical protein [Niallia circulans]MCM3360797.1 hypothetical protein [Niallia sp. MER TA 168]CAI9388442.1 hypothetical protein BACSP_00227 [Bacillus sp. T2.9-1]
MKKISFILVIVLLAFIAYIETPTASINKNQVLFYSPTNEDQEVSSNTDEIFGAPELEYKLEETKEEDGFIVEVYREYEIYKNRQGDIVKTVATDNTEFIHYVKY